MSGFAGIFQRDGKPVDAQLLDRLAASLRFRGPHGLGVWSQGEVGVVHALFVSDESRASPVQPIHRAGGLTLVGDIRLDARRDLQDALAPAVAGAQPLADAELALLAYERWGPDCVRRLQGDFAFAVWDAPCRRLFCARDPFGVRPLFYVARGDLLVFANTLDTLRLVPGVRSELDPLWIADFLVHAYPLEVEASVFADIRRVAPAQALTATRENLRKETYWEPPIPTLVRYAQPGQYVEKFCEVFLQAVADRAGGADTALYLSGGLDSAAIAAALAGRLGPAAGAPTRIHAHTTGFNVAFTDPEPAAAQETAAALGIPLTVTEAEDGVPFKGWEREQGVGPEPEAYFFRELNTASLKAAAGNCRVALNGQGGDEVLSPELVLAEVVSRKDPRLLADALYAWRVFRRPPFGLRGLLARAPGQPAVPVPQWLQPGLVQRLGLAERAQRALAAQRRPALPNALARVRLRSPLWPQYLELNDAGFTGVLLEQRWPFLDQRVIGFALSHPPFPWLMDKYVLRKALAPILPASICSRPKTPLAGNPLDCFVAQHAGWAAGQAWLDPHVGDWVDMSRLRASWDARGTCGHDPVRLSQEFRVIALAYWLCTKVVGATTPNLS